LFTVLALTGNRDGANQKPKAAAVCLRCFRGP
jgi:hypothetical protein